MKLSIIIPAYNAEKYIKKCIDSALVSYDSYEIIVVNDGSTDNTEEIVKGFKSDKIKYFYNKNSGVSFSRNFGIEKAKGDYIMFLDSDDCLSEGWLSNIKEILCSNLKYELIIYNKILDTNINKNEIIKYIVGMKKPLIAAVYSKLFLRNFIIDNKIRFNENVMTGEDMLFNIECLMKSRNYLIENKSIYLYRYVLGSLTNSYNEKYLSSNETFITELEKMLLNENEIEGEDIISFCKSNSTIELIERLIYLNNYNEFKRHLNKEIKYYTTSKYQAFRNKILMYLLKAHLYWCVFILLKLKHKIKKIKKQKETFIEV